MSVILSAQLLTKSSKLFEGYHYQSRVGSRPPHFAEFHVPSFTSRESTFPHILLIPLCGAVVIKAEHCEKSFVKFQYHFRLCILFNTPVWCGFSVIESNPLRLIVLQAFINSVFSAWMYDFSLYFLFILLFVTLTTCYWKNTPIGLMRGTKVGEVAGGS